MDDFEAKVRDALANPKNQGELPDADAVGTVGSPDCGDMLRMWLKFTEKEGERVMIRTAPPALVTGLRSPPENDGRELRPHATPASVKTASSTGIGP